MTENIFENEQTRASFEPKIWKKLWPFVRPYRYKLLLIVALMVVIAGVDIAMPLFQRYAIDTFITPGTTDGLWVFVLAYVGVLVVQALSVIIFSRASMVVEMNLGRSIRRACFVHLQQLSFSYYNQTPVGYILARVMSDTNRISSLVAWGSTICSGPWPTSSACLAP